MRDQVAATRGQVSSATPCRTDNASAHGREAARASAVRASSPGWCDGGDGGVKIRVVAQFSGRSRRSPPDCPPQRARSSRLLPHPWIKRERLRAADADSAKVPMNRIQQIVPLRRHDDRGHIQHRRAPLAKPLRAVTHACALRWLDPPSARWSAAVLNGHRVRNLDAEVHELELQGVIAQMNERLDGRQRQRRRGVHNRLAGSIPAPARESCPFPAKRGARVPRLGNAVGGQQR